MAYYAHTADRPDGTRDPDVSKWQLLSAHLRNVAELAAKFAAPFNASDEARLAGLLHDLGKYAAANIAAAARHCRPLRLIIYFNPCQFLVIDENKVSYN